MIKESLLRRKAEVEKMPRELKERAQSKNQNGFEQSKEKFQLKFGCFKDATKTIDIQNKIEKLENLIWDTQKMFENDMHHLCI